MSIQSARERRNDSQEEQRERYPERPEAVKYAIACLYGAAFISLSFLLMTGETHWYGEGLQDPTLLIRAALIHMGICAVVDGGTGYALSRCMPWIKNVFFVLTGIGVVVQAITMSELIGASAGFFIARILILFMELGAVFLLTRQGARNWFELLKD